MKSKFRPGRSGCESLLFVIRGYHPGTPDTIEDNAFGGFWFLNGRDCVSPERFIQWKMTKQSDSYNVSGSGFKKGRFCMACPITVASIIFGGLWLAVFIMLGEGPFEMDPNGKPGAFEDHLKRYQNLAQLVVTLSAATVAFLINALVGISADKSPTLYTKRLESASVWTLPLLGFSIMFALLFILLENMSYERYSHRVTECNSPYTRSRYATNSAFGHSSLVLFVLSYAILAYRILHG
jgi:hypothetical protein